MDNAPQDLTDLSTHFAFGENWVDYARNVSDLEIAQAVNGLSRLVDGEQLTGRSFLDIGCGSGIHSLAAQRLGAVVSSVDLDPASVAATDMLLKKFSRGAHHSASVCSVFELDPEKLGTFDIVYSWGVLHHTGDMASAIRHAAAMVKPKGEFIFALYRKTRLCGFWTLEKRWYTKASPASQKRAQRVFAAWFRSISHLVGLMRGRRFRFDEFERQYHETRGMDVDHDIHDWLGGYPYESALPGETVELMKSLGFKLKRLFPIKKSLGAIPGIFGSGCDEYVFERTG